MNIKQLRVADEGEYDPADYMPTSEKSVDGMYEELMRYGKQVKNPYLQQVIRYYFVNDEQFIKSFKAHSAAKSVSSWICRRTSGAHIKRSEIL